MTPFNTQLEALKRATLLIERLPAGSSWSFTITEDDDGEEMLSALNIYAVADRWSEYRYYLSLIGAPIDVYVGHFCSYKFGSLLVSLIDPDKETDYGPDA